MKDEGRLIYKKLNVVHAITGIPFSWFGDETALMEKIKEEVHRALRKDDEELNILSVKER